MDILNLAHNNFNNNKSKNNNIDSEVREIDFSSKVSNECKLPVNIFINDSYNDLILKFETTHIIMLTPSATQRSKLSHSLPNIFIPSYFDDDKLRDDEKEVQWMNKLYHSWGSLRSAFRVTCDYWLKQGRSKSIPNLQRSINKRGRTNSSERYIKDVHQTTPETHSDEEQWTSNGFLPEVSMQQSSNNERKSISIEACTTSTTTENTSFESNKVLLEKSPQYTVTDNGEVSDNVYNSMDISQVEDVIHDHAVHGEDDLRIEKTHLKPDHPTNALLVQSCLSFERDKNENELVDSQCTISELPIDLDKTVDKASSPKGVKRKSVGHSKNCEDYVNTSRGTEASKSLGKKQRRENYPPFSGANITKRNSTEETLKYRRIRTNTYVDPKPSHWSRELEKCNCKPSRLKERYDSKSTVWDCTANCLNRLMYTECDPKTCPCGELCNNQKIRKSKWISGLKLVALELKGRGAITTKSIREGTLITEYVGEVIHEETFQERMANLYRDDAHHYCLHLDREMLIDAYRSGSIARFVNHSCQPNCQMQKWMVNGAYRMCLFANEDISPGTELTYDYNFSSFNTKTAQICLCGSPNCRGFIGGRPRMEQSECQKDRKKLLLAFGRILSVKEKMFIRRRSIFLVRGRNLGRCRRLGISEAKQNSGKKVSTTGTELERRNSKKKQFLSQMSALNSIRSVRTRLLKSAQDDVHVTRTAQLAQILRELYNTLLEQKDPLNPDLALVDLFVNELKPKKYPELYRVIGDGGLISLSQVYRRLLNGCYASMCAFDQDMLTMMDNIEKYAGKMSKAGKSVLTMRPIYRDLKMNAIAIYEALTDELFTEVEKTKLLSNELTPKDVRPKTPSEKDKKNKKQKSDADKGQSLGAEVIKCVCEYVTEAGQVMIQCDRCFVWQHVDCMNIARSSDSVDVTTMDPYQCHICSNVPLKTLIREIPLNLVSAGRTFFWTLLCADSSLLKVDDFVYISSKEGIKPLTAGFSEKWIMRICSLWKDSEGQNWMEGALLLRPYCKLLEQTRTDEEDKKSPSFDLSSHRWHLKEVVYTAMTRILPLNAFLGRCYCLNSDTFMLGRPHTQNTDDDVYLCDWSFNKEGKWSDVASSCLEINTQSYCFNRYIDDPNYGVRVLKSYVAEELLKFDQKLSQSGVGTEPAIKWGLNVDEKKLKRKQMFGKLLTKLSQIALQRVEKSLTIQDEENFDHIPRKHNVPIKIVHDHLNSPCDMVNGDLLKEEVKCNKGTVRKATKKPSNKVHVPTKIRKMSLHEENGSGMITEENDGKDENYTPSPGSNLETVSTGESKTMTYFEEHQISTFTEGNVSIGLNRNSVASCLLKSLFQR